MGVFRLSTLAATIILSGCQQQGRVYDTLMPASLAIRSGAPVMLDDKQVGKVSKIAYLRDDPTLQVLRMRVRLDSPLEIDAIARAADEGAPIAVILSRGDGEPIPDSDGVFPIICSDDVPKDKQNRPC